RPLVEHALNRGKRDAGGFLQRIGVDTRADRRKCDGAKSERRRQLEARSIRTRKQIRLTAAPAAPYRTDGVNHFLCGKVSGGRRNGAAGRATALLGPDPVAFEHDRGAARAMDRSIHAAAADQARVGGVDDRVDLLLRDVADDEREYRHGGPDLTPSAPAWHASATRTGRSVKARFRTVRRSSRCCTEARFARKGRARVRQFPGTDAQGGPEKDGARSGATGGRSSHGTTSCLRCWPSPASGERTSRRATRSPSLPACRRACLRGNARRR